MNGYEAGHQAAVIVKNRKVRWGVVLGIGVYIGIRIGQNRMGKTMFTLKDVKTIVTIDRIMQGLDATIKIEE